MWAWSREERAGGTPGCTSSPLPFPESLTACCLLSLHYLFHYPSGISRLTAFFVPVGGFRCVGRAPTRGVYRCGRGAARTPPLSSPKHG
ncbi:hypothetical protein E2C01_068214 [Portunus trituberculatus]|uniref:Uncharacterized protein n=1 Tax=Portunus trituberculatus TaxID=210409 RepID=A0A5B7HV69_PORTR|nr:hypothetical protein [Portunus trituberculatus]